MIILISLILFLASSFFLLRYRISVAIVALFSIVFSQSAQDLQKLKSEFAKIQKSESQSTLNNVEQSNIDTGLPKKFQIIPNQLLIGKDSLDNKLLHFGYNFFTSRDTVAFWENLPTPANYLLGPGDELIISLWGETQLRKKYIISRDGKIYDDKVGLLNLMGKSIEDAEMYLKSQFGRIYATLNGNSPSSYIDISLGKLRSINVNFVGETKFPGVYPVHPFSTVITGLIQAGGIDTTGSLRNIQIKREGVLISSIDLYDYLLKGDLPRNIQLRDQDVVVVPVRQFTVTIDSAVNRPGIYESKGNETVKQMIDYAGGITPNASSIVGLRRIIPINERVSNVLTVKNHYIDYLNSQLTPVKNGDLIIVRTIFKSLNQVKIIGQVKNPGTYYFYPGMKLKDLIKLGGGFGDTTFWKSVYQSKGELIRRNPETRYETVIDVDLNKVINGNGPDNIFLQNLDRFVVHANLNFFEREPVQVLGEVNIPGSYPLISDNENLNSILKRSGNLTSKAMKNGISIYRDKKYFEITKQQEALTEPRENPQVSQINEGQAFEVYQKKEENKLEKVRVAWKNDSIILMPGDSIVVKESTGTINVFGQVYNPGLIEFRKGKSINYYLNAAGGVTDRGSKSNIIIVYANGFVSPNKWYSSSKVYDGSTIIINAKEIQPPFNITQFATNWTTIFSSMITVIILSKSL